MSWSEVRALRDAGMDVQSHSHHHMVLSTLTPSSVEEDLSRSASILGEVISEPVHSVAYPVGGPMAGAHRRATATAGFALGFTNKTGLCDLNRFDPLNVPRISMEIGVDRALCKLLFLLGERPGEQPNASIVAASAVEGSSPTARLSRAALDTES
jgi:peptidoglycan/xylan/chitin deacetylase (PgdA/CDA1 family)